jgi:hypothetical protein
MGILLEVQDARSPQALRPQWANAIGSFHGIALAAMPLRQKAH